MTGGSKSLSLMRRAMWPALALVIVGNFATYAVAGPNGLLALGGYKRTLAERQTELSGLEADRDRLRSRSAALNPRKADPDLADELVRRDLGLVRGDEVIVPLN